MDTGERLTRALDARYRFQVFVDSQQVMVSPVLIGGPRHHLKQGAIERRVEAVCGDGRGAVGMEVIVVNAEPDGVVEFSKRGTTLGESSLVGRQIAGHNVWRNGAGRNRTDLTEIPATSQVGRGIHGRRRSEGTQPQVWVVTRGKLSRRPGTVTAVALAHGIDDIAAQPNQLPVVFGVGQMHRRDLQPLFYPRFVAGRLIVVIGTNAWGTDQRSHQDEPGKSCDGSDSCEKFLQRHSIASISAFTVEAVNILELRVKEVKEALRRFEYRHLS